MPRLNDAEIPLNTLWEMENTALLRPQRFPSIDNQSDLIRRLPCFFLVPGLIIQKPRGHFRSYLIGVQQPLQDAETLFETEGSTVYPGASSFGTQLSCWNEKMEGNSIS